MESDPQKTGNGRRKEKKKERGCCCLDVSCFVIDVAHNPKIYTKNDHSYFNFLFLLFFQSLIIPMSHSMLRVLASVRVGRREKEAKKKKKEREKSVFLWFGIEFLVWICNSCNICTRCI